jgi:uncharacterized membrane protein
MEQDSPFSQALAQMMDPVATALELFGVLVIVLSVALATVKFILDLRAETRKDAYAWYRANLGRGILLGLELLVGADIIATVTAPLTWESVGLLGVIVLIRTFLSFSLETEIEGEWPWRRRQRGHGEAR